MCSEVEQMTTFFCDRCCLHRFRGTWSNTSATQRWVAAVWSEVKTHT